MNEATRKSLLGGIEVAFSDRNFRVYSIGSIASWVSYFIQVIAVSWLTWELTGSTLWLSIMALLDIVPSVLLLPFTGAVADRYDRHKVLILSCIAALLVSAAMAAAALAGVLNLPLLAVLVLIDAATIAFMVPAMYGTLPRFVDKDALPSAIAVSSAYVQVAIFAGPLLAGWIISSYGVAWAFVVNAIAYVILTAAFFALRTPEGFHQEPSEEGSVLSQISGGIRYLIGHRRMLTFMVLGTTVNIINIGTYYMMPAYSELVLGMGVIGMTLVLSAEGAGATVAALWIARAGATGITDNRVLWSVPVAIVLCAALIATPNIVIALAISFVLGVALEVRKTGTMTIVQTSVAENQRGRVMATWFMFRQLAGGIGAFAIGKTAEYYGLLGPTMICAGVCLAIWFAVYLRRTKLIGTP